MAHCKIEGTGEDLAAVEQLIDDAHGLPAPGVPCGPGTHETIATAWVGSGTPGWTSHQGLARGGEINIPQQALKALYDARAGKLSGQQIALRNRVIGPQLPEAVPDQAIEKPKRTKP